MAVRPDRGSQATQQMAVGQQDDNGGGGVLILGGAAALGLIAYELFKKKPAATTPAPAPSPVPVPTAGRPALCADFPSQPSWWSTLDAAGKSTLATFCLLLGRVDQAGAAYWTGAYRTGLGGYLGVPAVAYGIINDSSEEFRCRMDDWANYVQQTQLPGATNYPAAWVTGLYLALLGRQPDVSEVAYWVPDFQNSGRLHVAMGFAVGSEFAQDVAQQVTNWGG